MYHTIYDEATKTWSGLKAPPIFNPYVSVAHGILNALKIHSNKIGQVIRTNEPMPGGKFSILLFENHLS